MSIPRHLNAWLLVFLALLWFGATFVYFGNTGKYSDDWCASSRRLDGGGWGGIDWSSHPWQIWPFFWRPLHLIHVWVVNTIFWRHDWVGHLELALVHAAVCVVLYRLLVRLGSARVPAMAAALLFGTCPLLGEAIGWFCASCNAIGSLLMLVTLVLGCRFGSELPASRSPTRRLVAIALLSFATACFYEPAAACLAAMPLVVWIASPRAAGLGARWRRTIMATIAAGLPCALYVALLVGTAPSWERGALDTVGNLGSVRHSLRSVPQWFGYAVYGPRGRDTVVGSFEQGLAAAWEHPLLLAVVAATALAGMISLIASTRAPPAPISQSAELAAGGGTGARGQLLLLGIVLMLASWLPFIAQHDQKLAPRSLYVPLLAAAFLVAAAGNAIRRGMGTLSQRGRTVARVMAAGAVGVLAILGQVGLMGMQTQFRGVARHDAFVAEQLWAMSSHVEPETVFIILRDDHAGAATSRPGYNMTFHTALRDHWAATRFLRLSMRRSDVRALTGNYTGRSPVLIDHLSSEGVRDTGIGSKDPFVPWASIVPLWIDAQAGVHVVQALTIVPLHGLPLEIRPARAQRLARTAAAYGTDHSQIRVRLDETPLRKTRVFFEPPEIPARPEADSAR